MASVTEVFGFSLFAHGVASGFQQDLLRRPQVGPNSNKALMPHWLAYTTVAEEDDEEFQAATNLVAAGGQTFSSGAPPHQTRVPPAQQQGQDLQQESPPPTGKGRHSSLVSKLDVIYRGPGASIAHDQEASVQVCDQGIGRWVWRSGFRRSCDGSVEHPFAWSLDSSHLRALGFKAEILGFRF